MKKEVKTLALYRIDRAKETFEEGVTLLENDSLPGAINRFYYAGFYAARALLATKELDSSKHSGVIALFQKFFVKTNLIPADLSKALPKSFERRQDSDYEDFAEINKQEVEMIKEQISSLLDKCEKLLKKLISS